MSADFLVATLDQRLPIFSDQLTADIEVFNALKEKGRMKMGAGGDGYSFTVRSSRSALVRAIGDLSVGQARSTATTTKVEGEYAAYGAELLVSRLQIKRNQAAGQGSKIFDLWEEQVNEVYESFWNYLGNDAYADGTAGTLDEATPMIGLAAGVDTDNTYLGIDRTASANAYWRANLRAISTFLADTDADGVVNGLYAMRQAWLDACSGGDSNGNGISRTPPTRKNKPDVLIGTKTAYLQYCAALQPQQQYVSRDKQDPGAEVAFFGLPFRWDTLATADTIRFLTSKTWELRVVGDSVIYRDIEDELGLSGQPRAKAIGLVAQLALFCKEPRANSWCTGADS
jgi:hypothetical protein